MTNVNGSINSQDARSILRIIYEKATFGAAPVSFQIEGDDRWHPCQFVTNPSLAAVHFTDGSVVYVDARTVTGSESGGGLDDSDAQEFSRDVDRQILGDLEQQVSGTAVDSVMEDEATNYYAEPQVNLRSMFGTSPSPSPNDPTEG